MAKIIVCEGDKSVKVEIKNPWGEFPTDPATIRRIAKILGGLASCENVVRRRRESFTAAQRKSRRDSYNH